MTTSAKLPPPLKRFAPGERVGRRQRASEAAHPVPARWRPARSAHGRQQAATRPAEGHRRGRAAHRSGQRRPGIRAAAGNFFFQPDGPGFARVTVIDGAGAADSVLVRLDDGASATLLVPAARSACPLAPCDRP